MEMTQICDTLARWLTQNQPADPGWSPDMWQTFQLACRVHGVAPLLHARLQNAGWLDEAMRQWLAGQYNFNRQRVTKMRVELQEILALFAQNNVPLMPLKGSILTATYYTDPALRPMADLDLLIRPDDLAPAARLLGQLGYERDITHWKHIEFSKPHNRQVVSKSCEHPENPRPLEIHLRCRETFGGPTLDLTDLMWAGATNGTLLGQPAMLPGLQALWLHLLAHCTYHLWQGRGRLIHLVDLARLAPHLGSPALLNDTDARFTYPALALLQKYFPAAIDDALVAAQRRRVSAKFQRWVNSLNLVNTSHLNPEPAGLYLFKALHFAEGRPREVMQALRLALLPNLQEMALDHPRLARSKMAWLAYFLLPLDWLKRATGKEKL